MHSLPVDHWDPALAYGVAYAVATTAAALCQLPTTVTVCRPRASYRPVDCCNSHTSAVSPTHVAVCRHHCHRTPATARLIVGASRTDCWDRACTPPTRSRSQSLPMAALQPPCPRRLVRFQTAFDPYRATSIMLALAPSAAHTVDEPLRSHKWYGRRPAARTLLAIGRGVGALPRSLALPCDENGGHSGVAVAMPMAVAVPCGLETIGLWAIDFSRLQFYLDLGV